jgi:hypothetical protein
MKNNLYFILLVFLPGVLFAQETLTFIAEKDTTAYNWEGDKTIMLHAGDQITMNGKFGYYRVFNGSLESHIGMSFEKQNTEYNIFVKNLRPALTEDVFGKDIFIDYPVDGYDLESRHILGSQRIIGDVNEMWVPSYYCDVLIGKNRDRLIEIHKGLDDFNYSAAETSYYWYDNNLADIQNGRAMFYNAVIRLGIGTHFAVKNISKTTYGYKVDCIESLHDGRSDGRVPSEVFTKSLFWEKYKPGDAMTLLIYLDGDYMDIYVDSKEILFGTFVKVKREFIKQYQSLIKTDTCDLTNVQWPRRADGSMDYTLPNTSNNTPNRQTIEEINNDEPYEGINAKNDAERHFPLWAWFAIIGGAAVVVGGCAAFFIIKRKK